MNYARNQRPRKADFLCELRHEQELAYFSEIYGWHITGEDLVASLYPKETVDFALPQHYVDEALAKGHDVRGRLVWGYTEDVWWGKPLPITAEGQQILEVLESAASYMQ